MIEVKLIKEAGASGSRVTFNVNRTPIYVDAVRINRKMCYIPYTVEGYKNNTLVLTYFSANIKLGKKVMSTKKLHFKSLDKLELFLKKKLVILQEGGFNVD